MEHWRYGMLGTSNLVGYTGKGKTLQGYTGNIYFGKTSGRFNFQLNETVADDKYNISDLGYYTNNNYWEQSLYAGYSWTKPTKWYNQLRTNFNSSYIRRLKMPSDYTGINLHMNVNGQLKNLWWAGFFLGYEPPGRNYYEPRVEGRFFKGWRSSFGGIFVETNYAKKYQVSAELFYVDRSFFNSKKYSLSLNQKYRFNDKLSVGIEVSIEPQTNNVGFADIAGSDIIFGVRDISTIENNLGIKYNFNKKMGFRADIRHSWSKVDYKDQQKNFYLLLPDGILQHTTSYTGNVNQNYNDFYINTVYTWEFAPGSFINLVWKNTNPVGNFNQVTKEGYFKNLDNTLGQSHNNNVSFKIIYLLDYLQLKNDLKKK